jgi:parallel beta-helix repeat protein
MKCANVLRFGVTGVALVCGAMTLSAAGTIYVGTCGTPNTTTVQAAVTAAGANGTVRICPGVYYEQVKITTNLNLTGVASGTGSEVVITSPTKGVVANSADLYSPSSLPVAAQILVENASSVNISNVIVDGTGNQIATCGLDLRGIYYQNASGILNSVVTRNQELPTGYGGCQSGQGIFVQSGYSTKGTANVIIENSSVHAYQKNGITVDGSGASANIQNNYVAGQGSTTNAAENGIQISDGAAASIINNVVADDIWAPDTATDTGDAASGILIYASENVLVQSNTISTTQYGIVTVSDSTSGTSNNPQGLGDHTTISGNKIQNTEIFDAIDACSNSNTIAGNIITNATESGIHLDSTCGSTGKNNTVSLNSVNESCAGILEGSTSNNISGLATFNVLNTTLSGNTCSVSTGVQAAVIPLVAGTSSGTTPHPTPVR